MEGSQNPTNPQNFPQQETTGVGAQTPGAQEPQPGQSQSQQTQSPHNQRSEQNYAGYYDESALFPGMTRPQKEEVLLAWSSPSRPFKKHNRQFYSTVGMIGALIAFILFFAGQIIPVAVVFAVVFVVYVMNSIAPGEVTHKLTTYGIRVEDELYYWEELGRFWIKEKYDKPVLYIEVGRFPSRLTILLGEIPKEDMQLILSEVLLNEEPPPTSYEKAAKWLHDKIPIDIES
jgi:hypothetical protein